MPKPLDPTRTVLVEYKGKIVVARLVPTSTLSEYKTFYGMWTRCTNPNHVGYAYYGARGIKICDRWKSFANFF